MCYSEVVYDWEQEGDVIGQDPWTGVPSYEIDHEERLRWCLERPAYREQVREGLRLAYRGEADYMSRGAKYISHLDPPLWELIQVGTRWEPAPGMASQGQGGAYDYGCDVPVYRSRLTKRGEGLLRGLAQDLPPFMREFYGLQHL